MVKNTAFVFIKPHANTEEVQKMVTSFLETRKLTITKTGTISAEDIDAKKLIDKVRHTKLANRVVLASSRMRLIFTRNLQIAWCWLALVCA